ncbi:hypothetical protein BDQ94DRAFT_143712 [Aspergillus welwitschiae]|uniref:Uncharacterized protein n=1 Tax=Aspergillus welwitschiae TaxID=1341132 RepID=A0A3F3Q1Q7_9EURO|nr:hypothetical protein BDQ94DRAFT_143712 [Aspergillus welwitschiae]RDH33164.1 hypothetical protein BDQ94DRAFT_143712 [Aspergillus welwitschiae]
MDDQRRQSLVSLNLNERQGFSPSHMAKSNPLGPEEHRADAELSDYSMGNST